MVNRGACGPKWPEQISQLGIIIGRGTTPLIQTGNNGDVSIY
jgi:hypothetical protein